MSKPNEWIKTAARSRGQTRKELTPAQALQLDFWTLFRDYLQDHGSLLSARKPYPHAWMDFAIGRSYFWMSGWANTRDRRIGAALVVAGPDGQANYQLLQQDRERIEEQIGSTLEWDFSTQRKQNYVVLHNYDFDPWDREMWPKQQAWLREKLELFHRAFADRVKKLNAADYVPDEGDE